MRRYGGRNRSGYDFRILDRNGGAGWDLACRLTRRRNALNRGRLSAAQVRMLGCCRSLHDMPLQIPCSSQQAA